MDPAEVWRGRKVELEPWPSRVEAFLTACAMHAGQRESDLINIFEGFGKGLEDAKRKG